MKKLFVLLTVLILASCTTPVSEKPDVPDVTVTPDTPDTPTVDTDTGTLTDPRLSLVSSAADAKWIRKPTASRGIASGDPVASICVTPSWSYMFYDDGAVIGYEPFPDNVSVMANAVAVTVESHNMGHPEAPWDFINVPPVAPPPPVTSNDPILGVWQVCLCLDDGSIVAGIYTAEFDFNWTAFKSTIPAELEVYNRDHDPEAHAVWGTDKTSE